MNGKNQYARVLLINDDNALRIVIVSFLRSQVAIDLIDIVEHVEASPLYATDDRTVILLGLRRSLQADLAYIRQKLPETIIILIGSLPENDREKVAAVASVDSYVDTDNLLEELVPEIRRFTE